MHKSSGRTTAFEMALFSLSGASGTGRENYSAKEIFETTSAKYRREWKTAIFYVYTKNCAFDYNYLRTKY